MDYTDLKRISRTYSPEAAREPEPPPVCTRSERCQDCPYPHHGFICWSRDESCMRTEVEKINKSLQIKSQAQIEEKVQSGLE